MTTDSPPAGYRRVMSRRSWALDVGIALVVLVLGQVEVWNGAGATHRQGPAWAQALVYAVGAALLVLRRVRPLETLAALTAAYAVEFALVGSPEGFGVALPFWIAAYSVGRWERRRPAWWGLVLISLFGLAWIFFDPLAVTWADRFGAVSWVSTMVVAWLLGALVRSQLQNAEQRRQARAERAGRAVVEERNRIARELHDVLGHSVSVMTVQAAAVRRRLAPEQAAEREALESVEAVGRQALAEMRRMVGVLREADETASRQPPPSLADATRLVEQVRAAGLPVELVVTGSPRPLAPGLDLTAYRLLQEGLTNALRHADSPRRAEVSIEYAPEALRLAVRDDGRPVDAGSEAGHGLLGLRERVAAYGGELTARPRPGGGFELLATLPAVTA
jgi:signal transduction histidine kinase